MIGCLRTRVRKQPIIALYFESENELKLYNLEAWAHSFCFHDKFSLECICISPANTTGLDKEKF